MKPMASLMTACLLPLLLATCGGHSSAAPVSGDASRAGGVPSGIPGLAAEHARSAQAWHQDAFLVRVDVHNYFVEPGRPLDRSGYSVALSYYSASAAATQVIVLGPSGQNYAHPAATTDTTRLPDRFIDLPDAVAAANAIGLGPRLTSATLRWRSSSAEGSHALWELTAPGGRSSRLVVMADSGKAVRYGDLCEHCQSGEDVTNQESAQARTAIAGAQSTSGNADRIPDGPIEAVSFESSGIYGPGFVTCTLPTALPNPFLDGCREGMPNIKSYVCLNVVRAQGRLVMLRGSTAYGTWCSIKTSSDGVGYHVVNQATGLQVYIDFPHANGSHLLRTTWEVLRYDQATCRSRHLITHGNANPCP